MVCRQSRMRAIVAAIKETAPRDGTDGNQPNPRILQQIFTHYPFHNSTQNVAFCKYRLFSG